MKAQKRIVLFDQPHDLSIYLFKSWIDLAHQSLKDKDRFSVALQGGETFKEFFSKLSSIDDASFWSRIHLFQTDQFHSPGNHRPHHQFRFLKENLIDYIHIPETNVHPIWTHTQTADQSCDQYQEDLTVFFNLKVHDTPELDCAILGIKYIDHLRDLLKPHGSTELVTQSTMDRMTLIAMHSKILARCKHLIFVGAGVEDAQHARQWVEDWGQSLSCSIQDSPETITFLLDSSAAYQLSKDYEFTHQAEGVCLFKR